MNENLTNLFFLSERIGERFNKRSRRMSRSSLFVKLALISIGGLIAACAPFFLVPEGESFGPWNFIGVLGAALVFLGGIYIAITDEDASKELEDARAAITTAYSLSSDLEDMNVYHNEMERARELYFAMKTMAQTLEAWMMQGGGNDEYSIIESLVESSARSLRIALGFQVSDHWTLCVYKALPNDRGKRSVLKCVGHDRSMMCELSKARQWPDGVGIPGVTFASGREVIIPDLYAPGVADVFYVNEEVEERETDKERYKSAAAVPIVVEPDKTPWGVVVSTSSRLNHFHNHSIPGLHSIETIRALSAMIALAFSANTSISNTASHTGAPSAPKS